MAWETRFNSATCPAFPYNPPSLPSCKTSSYNLSVFINVSCLPTVVLSLYFPKITSLYVYFVTYGLIIRK